MVNCALGSSKRLETGKSFWKIFSIHFKKEEWAQCDESRNRSAQATVTVRNNGKYLTYNRPILNSSHNTYKKHFLHIWDWWTNVEGTRNISVKWSSTKRSSRDRVHHRSENILDIKGPNGNSTVLHHFVLHSFILHHSSLVTPWILLRTSQPSSGWINLQVHQPSCFTLFCCERANITSQWLLF